MRYHHMDEILADLHRVEAAAAAETQKRIRPPTPPAKRRLLASPLLWTVLIVFFGLAVGVLLFYPHESIPFS